MEQVKEEIFQKLKETVGMKEYSLTEEQLLEQLRYLEKMLMSMGDYAGALRREEDTEKKRKEFVSVVKGYIERYRPGLKGYAKDENGLILEGICFVRGTVRMYKEIIDRYTIIIGKKHGLLKKKADLKKIEAVEKIAKEAAQDYFRYVEGVKKSREYIA